jgi:hypothetical protein
MNNLEEHVREAQNTLEAAQTSVNAARRAYEASGSEADGYFLRDAETALQEARAMYDAARNAQEHTEPSNHPA